MRTGLAADIIDTHNDSMVPILLVYAVLARNVRDANSMSV